MHTSWDEAEEGAQKIMTHFFLKYSFKIEKTLIYEFWRWKLAVVLPSKKYPKWGFQILVLTPKTWNNYKGAPLHAFCCTKKGFKVPQIAPWSFVKIWTKNITPQVFVHCAAIFQRICKCHTILESWDQALSGIEAHLIENSRTNEKSAPVFFWFFWCHKNVDFFLILMYHIFYSIFVLKKLGPW